MKNQLRQAFGGFSSTRRRYSPVKDPGAAATKGCAGKITGMPEPVPDPYGGDEAAYRAALETIFRGVKELFR